MMVLISQLHNTIIVNYPQMNESEEDVYQRAPGFEWIFGKNKVLDQVNIMNLIHILIAKFQM